MKKLVKQVVFLLVVLSLALSMTAATYPQAAVSSVVQDGQNLVIGGTVPNMPQPWGWTAFAGKPTFDHKNKIISIMVYRRGSDCPTCGISNPPFVPYSLTVAVGNYAGYVVKVNGKYWVILE